MGRLSFIKFMGICDLCEQEKQLQNSHLIPQFIFNWISKTSATGYLRRTINPNLRVQDGIKNKLLCRDCEQKFSKYEKYFADNIFYPYLNKTKTQFNYNKALQLFIISISWRILKHELYGLENHQPSMYHYAKETEIHWRNLLLNDKVDHEYEHHLFLFDYILDGPKDLPDKFQFYMMRGTDGTIASSKNDDFL